MTVGSLCVVKPDGVNERLLHKNQFNFTGEIPKWQLPLLMPAAMR